MTRSADDETLRVPAGCPKHPVQSPCLRRTPGGTRRWDAEAPRRTEACIRSNCLWSTSWRARGPCLRVCDSLARPGDVRRSCVATQPRHHGDRMSASKRSAVRHLAFRDSEGRRFRSGWRARCTLSASGTEGHFASPASSFPEERRAVSERVCLLESPASTTLLHAHSSRSPLRPRPGRKRAR
jgi:hypothetical protein